MISKIVINGRFLLQGVTGVQRVGIEFCRALDELLMDEHLPGLEVEVVYPARGPVVTELNLRRIRLRRYGMLGGHAWEQLELPLAARGAHLLALGNTAPLLRLIRRKNATHVMVHDLSYRYFPEAYSRSFRLVYGLIMPVILSRAERVITVSAAEREAILREYPKIGEERLVYAQNGADVRIDHSAKQRPASAKGCLYVGSLTKRKNAERLIQAAIEVSRSESTEFTFVGSTGASFEGVSIDIPEDAQDYIRFLGQLNGSEEISAQYLAAEVFVFPSLYEASPLPPVEAMAHGVPVVAADIPSLRERCGDAAFYVDPLSIDSIVNGVRTILRDDSLRDELRSKGYERARAFSWRTQALNVIYAMGVARKDA